MQKQFNRTRLAPTPSGYLHLGNIYSFGITLKLARQYSAKVFLRIDDMDGERKDAKYVQDIFDTLAYLDVSWDEGPKDADDFERSYSQALRLPQYQVALEKLRQSGLVYACKCSRKEILEKDPSGVYTGTCRYKNIPLDEEWVNWRLDTSHSTELHVKMLEGTLTAQLPTAMKDFVVCKKDGMPAYQVTSLIDDVHFGTDLIVRGEDLWNSTLAQLYLARVLGLAEFEKATFFHHKLLRSASGEKLSKSAGDTSIQQLIRSGKSVRAIWGMVKL